MKTTDDVNKAFTSGSVATANAVELAEYLIALANARIQSDINQEVANRRSETIRLLLAAKQSQDLHSQSQGTARAALFVALAALLVSALQILYLSPCK
jgi:hypothetical protein